MLIFLLIVKDYIPTTIGRNLIGIGKSLGWFYLYLICYFEKPSCFTVV